MRRVHQIPPTVCSVCEAARIVPRVAEWLAYVERNRRPSETLLAAQQRLVMDAVFDFYGDDVPSIARLLSVNPSTISCMRKRRAEEARTLRLVREQTA